MTYTDLMIDLETTGRYPGCAIIQIAAVPFNINTGKVSKDVFKMAINLEVQRKADYFICPNTLKWWANENKELFKKLSEDKNHYIQVGVEFQRYFKSLPNYKKIRVWGNSNRFDIGILHGWYIHAIGKKFQPFWDTWSERDVRTLSSLKPEIKANMKFIGTKHNAIDDCKHQIKYCHETIKALKIKL